MGISKYVSDVKTIKHNNELVFQFLSNFNQLGKFFNEYTLAQISQQVPGVKIDGFRSDTDSCHFTINNHGEAGLRIIERDIPKTIKITGEGNIPFELFLWIQLVPVSAYESKIRLTLHADLNMMLKLMAGKKLQEGINKLADALTLLPYQQ
ncbi:MAG: hypothetical protein JXR22_11205 [Prolixibacteraceae bacterium]|nr:hypothetical protein [Prolixibacteraceae bacterium]